MIREQHVISYCNPVLRRKICTSFCPLSAKEVGIASVKYSKYNKTTIHHSPYFSVTTESYFLPAINFLHRFFPASFHRVGRGELGRSLAGSSPSSLLRPRWEERRDIDLILNTSSAFLRSRGCNLQTSYINKSNLINNNNSNNYLSVLML